MSRVYVGNLDPRVSERDLEDEFRVFGVIRSVDCDCESEMERATVAGWIEVAKVRGKSTAVRCFSKYPLKFILPNKTIVVAAVVPHGVAQLGSLNEVKEDFKLLIHIRDLFSSLQDSSTFHVQNPMECNMQSVLQMSDTSARTFNPDLLSEYILNVDRDACVSSSIIQPLAKQANDSYGTLLPGVYLDEAMILQERNELQEVIDNVNLIQPVSGIQNTGTSAGQQVCLSSQSCFTTKKHFI